MDVEGCEGHEEMLGGMRGIMRGHGDIWGHKGTYGDMGDIGG